MELESGGGYIVAWYNHSHGTREWGWHNIITPRNRHCMGWIHRGTIFTPMELDIWWESTPAIINDRSVIYCLDWEGGENIVRGWGWGMGVGVGWGLSWRYRKFVTIFSPRGQHTDISCFPNMNVIGLHWWSISIGSGNGLVPPGNKPLPEPIECWHRSLSLYGATRSEWVNWCYYISFTRYAS